MARYGFTLVSIWDYLFILKSKSSYICNSNLIFEIDYNLSLQQQWSSKSALSVVNLIILLNNRSIILIRALRNYEIIQSLQVVNIGIMPGIWQEEEGAVDILFLLSSNQFWARLIVSLKNPIIVSNLYWNWSLFLH